uniref:Putative secreted protein n=1 Tax=Ixodes ricinus TaxID=34613 RepID=A0A6B0U6R8_IXORI
MFLLSYLVCPSFPKRAAACLVPATLPRFASLRLFRRMCASVSAAARTTMNIQKIGEKCPTWRMRLSRAFCSLSFSFLPPLMFV